jgi:hypothetical protein
MIESAFVRHRHEVEAAVSLCSPLNEVNRSIQLLLATDRTRQTGLLEKTHPSILEVGDRDAGTYTADWTRGSSRHV